MEWVASTLHTTSEHGVSNITTADARAHLGCQQSTELTRPPIEIDSSVSPKDEKCFLRVRYHVSTGVYQSGRYFLESRLRVFKLLFLYQIQSYNSVQKHLAAVYVLHSKSFSVVGISLPRPILHLLRTQNIPISVIFPCSLAVFLKQCFSTAGPRPGTGPWHQLYRAARDSPGICHFSFLSSFHE